jgi:hypothetical protein
MIPSHRTRRQGQQFKFPLSVRSSVLRLVFHFAEITVHLENTVPNPGGFLILSSLYVWSSRNPLHRTRRGHECLRKGSSFFLMSYRYRRSEAVRVRKELRGKGEIKGMFDNGSSALVRQKHAAQCGDRFSQHHYYYVLPVVWRGFRTPVCRS